MDWMDLKTLLKLSSLLFVWHSCASKAVLILKMLAALSCAEVYCPKAKTAWTATSPSCCCQTKTRPPKRKRQWRSETITPSTTRGDLDCLHVCLQLCDSCLTSLHPLRVLPGSSTTCLWTSSDSGTSAWRWRITRPRSGAVTSSARSVWTLTSTYTARVAQHVAVHYCKLGTLYLISPHSLSTCVNLHLLFSGADRVGSDWPDCWCHRLVSKKGWNIDRQNHGWIFGIAAHC